MSAKRTHGTGALYRRKDAAGRACCYGRWHAHGRHLNRKLGPVRVGKDGLTKAMAERELRRLMGAVAPVAAPGEVLTFAEVAERYVEDLHRRRLKRASIVAAESTLKAWLLPFFGDRAMGRISTADVEELVRGMEAGQRRGERYAGDRRWGKPVGAQTIGTYVTILSRDLQVRDAPAPQWATVNPVAAIIELPRPEGSTPRSASLRSSRSKRWPTPPSRGRTRPSTERCT